MPDLSQDHRLMVAARIKAIADSGETFDSRLADEIADLLRGVPIARFSLRLWGTSSGQDSSGHAAGIGDVSVPDGEQAFSYSINDPNVRCGAYVIRKYGDRVFQIRHVMEVVAEEQENELLKLVHTGTRWEARVNRPRIFSLGIVTIIAGQRFDLWKVGDQTST